MLLWLRISMMRRMFLVLWHSMGGFVVSKRARASARE
jgi:hypothetical protein